MLFMPLVFAVTAALTPTACAGTNCENLYDGLAGTGAGWSPTTTYYFTFTESTYFGAISIFSNFSSIFNVESSTDGFVWTVNNSGNVGSGVWFRVPVYSAKFIRFRWTAGTCSGLCLSEVRFDGSAPGLLPDAYAYTLVSSSLNAWFASPIISGGVVSLLVLILGGQGLMVLRGFAKEAAWVPFQRKPYMDFEVNGRFPTPEDSVYIEWGDVDVRPVRGSDSVNREYD